MQEEHLSEVVGAVLENAVNYARRQVRITGAAGPEWTSLSVEDDGAGIAPELLEQALVRGHRLDEAGGSGLGLSIAREMVEAATAVSPWTPRRSVACGCASPGAQAYRSAERNGATAAFKAPSTGKRQPSQS